MTRPTPQKANDMSTTDFKITGPGWYMTRKGERVKVSKNIDCNAVHYPWKYGIVSVTDQGQESWGCDEGRDNDIVSRCPDDPPAPAPEPTRLERAKAALEEAHAAESVIQRQYHEALHRSAAALTEYGSAELAAAESEARTAQLPPKLVEVAREVFVDAPGQLYTRSHMLAIAARSHGVSVEDLRRAVEGGK